MPESAAAMRCSGVRALMRSGSREMRMLPMRTATARRSSICKHGKRRGSHAVERVCGSWQACCCVLMAQQGCMLLAGRRTRGMPALQPTCTYTAPYTIHISNATSNQIEPLQDAAPGSSAARA